MIKGIGIDTVAITRFTHWITTPDTTLSRIFTPEEIIYCKSQPTIAAERFAARFAAREAFFKAYCASGAPYTPFLTVCQAIMVTNGPHNEPRITLTNTPQGHLLKPHLTTSSLHLTITHTKTDATALVIISK